VDEALVLFVQDGVVAVFVEVLRAVCEHGFGTGRVLVFGDVVFETWRVGVFVFVLVLVLVVTALLGTFYY
jgi:hypothetical protein